MTNNKNKLAIVFVTLLSLGGTAQAQVQALPSMEQMLQSMPKPACDEDTHFTVLPYDAANQLYCDGHQWLIRPVTANHGVSVGQTRYNDVDKKLEYFDGNTWIAVTPAKNI